MNKPVFYVAVKLTSTPYPNLQDAMDSLYAQNASGFTLRAELDVKTKRVITIWPANPAVQINDLENAPPLPPGQRYVILQE